MTGLCIETYPDQPAECVAWDRRALEVAASVAALIVARAPASVVEHVGSTSVPGCAGKGVVDLMLLYPPGGLEGAKRALAELGFQSQRSRDPWPESRPMRIGVMRWRDSLYRLHVHVIAADAAEADELRAFRDRLRADPALVARYVARKRAVLAEGITDPVDYSAAKATFFTTGPMGRETG